MKNKYYFLFLFLMSSQLSANTYNIREIIILGNKKTKRRVIIRELDFKAGQVVSDRLLIASKKRLLNLNIFSTIKMKVTPNDILLIKVEERWTTIPILKFASGGGVTRITAGVYDPNIFGRFIESGAQFEKLQDTNSGVIWFKNPRLFNKRLGVDLQFWRTNRLRTKYDQNSDERIAKTGFLQTRDKAFIELKKEYKNFIFTKVNYEYNSDKFSDKIVPEDIKNDTQVVGLPASTTVHFFGLGASLGQINFDDFLVEGRSISAEAKYAHMASSGFDSFFQANLELLYYKTFFKNHTFAQRLKAGATNTDVLQYWYYLGGLEDIRGFADNRFAGKIYWLSNSEYRYPILSRKNYTVQTVGFFDVTSVREKFSKLTDITGASAGLGLRVFLPKIYRFTVRVDISKTLKKNDDNTLNFGVQQFF